MPIDKIIQIPIINEEIQFIIGKNAEDNFKIIDESTDEDIWFHLKDESSCHVIAKINNTYKKKELRYILKQGAILCKLNSKYKNVQSTPIIYTKIKNVTKTNILGSVIVKNEKTIIL